MVTKTPDKIHWDDSTGIHVAHSFYYIRKNIEENLKVSFSLFIHNVHII